MTPEDFVKWLDEMTIHFEKKYEDSPKYDKDQYAAGALEVLDDVKKNFLKLTPPATTLS